MFHGENQIGFQCFANYTPIKEGMIPIFHSNRTVVHPDYNGLGLGIKLIDESSKYMVENYGYRIMAKFSALPVYKSMIKNENWIFLGDKRVMGQLKRGGNMKRDDGFREGGIKTYHFEFKLKPNAIKKRSGETKSFDKNEKSGNA